MKSVIFGFPHIDTLEILETFGPGGMIHGYVQHAVVEVSS